MSGNRKSWNNSTRLALESLETRRLLSGIHAAAHAHVDDHHHSAIVSMSSVKAPADAAKSAGQQSETHLVATLADPAGVGKVTGTAKFESETEHGVAKSEFYVQVKGALPGTVIEVTLTGSNTPAGQITVKPDGTGQLKLKANAPAVAADAVISLGMSDAAGTITLLASGTFAKPTSTAENPHDEGSDHSGTQDETRLVASLADPTSKLTGSGLRCRLPKCESWLKSPLQECSQWLLTPSEISS